MKKEYLKNRAGVSLITVLMFMLIATIAATATWKFITSEGFSSTSRMLKREAYQSAQAGIENARSWMTFHANDVGGLIKQFQDNKGLPINIDNQLRTLQRAGQNYHVWLTGVNTSNSTYKLKILSSGEARNNTRHTEVAIFNVDGLYQVEVPKEKLEKPIDFEYAYYGGSIHYDGGNDVSSMVVNGNWNYNPPKTTSGDFIITGNAGLTGNEISVAKTTCIGGNLSGYNNFKFNGIRTKNLYIGGSAKEFIGIVDSNAYFDGKLQMSTSCGGFSFQIKGNMTVADTIQLDYCGVNSQNENEKGRYVNGNTCVIVSEDGTKSGQIRMDGKVVELRGSAWMAAPYSLWPIEDDRNYYSNYDKFIVGNASDDEIYIKNAKPWSFYNTNRIAKTFNEGTSDFQPNMTCSNGTAGMQSCSEWGTCKGAFGRSYKCCKKYTESGNCGTWKTWAVDTYSPYPEKAAQENLYLLFNDDIPDVDFVSHYNEYWKADVSSYYVGEALFFDLYSVWNEYNYENGKATGSPYCKKQGNFSPGSQDVAAHRPSCDVKPWFKVDGSFKEWTNEKPITCAESVKNHCFDIWEEGEGCDGAKYFVKDPLKVATDSIGKYANKAPCATAIASLTGNDLLDYDMKNGEKSLSKCYNDASDHDKTAEEKWLYNGYLVVDLPTEGIFKSPKNKLDGKFVIIIDSPGPNAEAIKLPPTNDNDDFVFLYLPEGYKQTNTYYGHEVVNNNSQIYLEGNGNFNYFIFSKKDIYGVKGQNHTLSGSIYLQLKDEKTGAATCAKLDHLWTANLQYNSALMASLFSNGIVCYNDGSPCGGTESTPASSSSNAADGSSSSNGGDRFYISMAPQLGVSLESQSKSFENVENLQKENGSDSLTPSFVILPRIVSLPTDPYGSLGDYLNVVSLNLPQNGTPLAKTDLDLGSCVTVSGRGSFGVSSLSSQLYTPGGEKLTKGSYKCEITVSSEGMPSDPVPVWVVVSDQELRSMHKVSFAAASQDIGSTGSKDVIVRLQPNIPTIQLNVSCPNPPSQWEYADLPSGVSVGGTCKFTVSNSENTEKLVKLFSVKTTDATSGTMNFQILPGEDYALDYPYISSIYMSSVASLYRDNVSSEHINSYCENHANVCPSAGWRDYWPTCEKLGSNDVWVAPDGAGYKTEIINDAWLITSAINTTVKLKDLSNGKCVVVIPDNESCTFSDSQKSCTLHASAKKKVHRIKFEFKNVESGTNPFFSVKSGSQIKTYSYNNDFNYPECITNAYGVHECTVNVYDGDSVSMKIETSLEANQDFRYWRCEGASCPDHSKLNSDTYPPFVLSENGSVVTVMFNEVDKHCFFDKFKSSAISCDDLRDDERKEYCIGDTCNSYRCGAQQQQYSDAKWLLAGWSGGLYANVKSAKDAMEMLDYSNGKISIKKIKDIKYSDRTFSITVMSTINADAGTHGILKALVSLPKESNGNHPLKKSGFLLGSDALARKYLILHMFIDDNGYVKAEVCNEEISGVCQEETLTITATEEDVIMIEANISADEITVTASKTNETSRVTIRFSLAYWEGSYQGSYVGYRLASPNFVLYGIGWKSENYECFNTYPTIKCSFNAVAQDGVIPREQYVRPWVGYSGWEGWDRSDCAEKYYYKGDDACGGYADGYTTCDNYGYYFNATSSGKHGYKDNEGNDVRTAKVGLDCHSSFNSYSTEEMLWASDSAHCGVFWTGSQNSCTTIEKITDIEILGLSEKSAAFKENGTVNLRDTRISVKANIPKDSEIWLWLSSEGHDGSEYRSEHVSVTSTSKEFDIEAFMSETGGFDPGKVKGVYFENKGSDEVTIKSLTTKCQTAVRVTGCSVEEKAIENSGISGIFGPQHTRIVEVSATVNNREHVEKYQVIAQKKEEPKKSKEFGVDEVTPEDEDKAIISLSKGRNEFVDGPFKEWNFAISVKPDDAGYSDTIPCSKAGETPRCKIEQPKDGEEKDQDKVEFRAVLEHCDGCSYVVEFDGSNKKHDNCSQDRCEISISKDEFTSLNVGDEYLFTLSSPNDEFEPCSSKVKIKAAPGQLGLSECSATGVGTVVTLTTKSEGCGPAESCSYSIEPGGTDGSGTYSDNQIITFFYGGDAKEHTLTVTKGSGTNAQTASCKFSVTYSSSSSSETSSSSVASSSSEESSSSVESSSSEESSSSVASSSSVVSSSSVAGETIMGDQELKDGYPAKKSYPSGTCFTITGTWTNQYYFASPKMQCNGRHITITYNGSEICSTVGSDNGTCTSSTLGTFTYQSSTTVFFEHICVTSQEGTNVECGLTN